MVGSLCALLLLQTSGVTLSVEAAPLHRVLEGLSRDLNRKLSVAADLRDEIVCIKVRERPAEELLDRLAHVVCGKWEREGETKRLVRDQDREKLLSEANLARRTELIKQAIQRMVDRQKQQGVFDRAAARQLVMSLKGDDDRYPDMRSRVQSPADRATYLQGLFGRAPTARLAVRLLMRMDPREIAKVPAGASIPFTLTPNSLQRPLGVGAPEAIDQFVAEQNLWAAYAQEIGDEALGRSPFFGDPQRETEPVQKQELTVVLRISVAGPEQSPRVSLNIFKSKGEQNHYFADYIGWSYRWDGKTQPDPPTSAAGNSPLELSELAKEWNSHTRRKSSRPLGAELREFLLNPEEHDPLTESSRILMQIADRRNSSLVACLGDQWRMLPLLLDTNQGQPGERQLLESMRGMAQIDQLPGLLQISFTDPVYHRQNRTPREALGKLARSVHAVGVLRLNEYADFVVSMEGESPFAYQYLEPLVPRSLQGVAASSRPMMRVYGHLTPDQRKALWEKGSVAVMNLPRSAANALNQAVYFTESFNALSILRSDREGTRHTVVPETTLTLPQGIPLEGQLQGHPESSSLLFATTDDGRSARNLSAQQLAESTFARERPDSDTLYQFNGEEYTAFLTGSRRSLTVSLILPGQLRGQANLSEIAYDPAAKRLAFKDLPERFRSEYETALQNLRKQYENVPRPKPGTPPPAR